MGKQEEGVESKRSSGRGEKKQLKRNSFYLFQPPARTHPFFSSPFHLSVYFVVVVVVVAAAAERFSKDPRCFATGT